MDRKGHPELQDAIDGFHQLYLGARGAPPTWPGRTIADLNRLMVGSRVGAAELLRRAEIMFGMAGRWPVEHGGDVATLIAHFDKFAGGAARGKRTALSAVLDIIATGEGAES